MHTFSCVPVGRERCYSHHSAGSLALSGSCIMSSLILVCISPLHCHPQRTCRGVWIAVLVILCPAVIKPTPVYITLHVVHTHPQRLAMNYHHQYENSHKIKQKLDPTMPFDITSGFSPARSLNRFTTIRLACGAVSWPHDDTGDIYVPAVG